MTMKTFKTKEGHRRRFINELEEEYSIEESELKFFRYCGSAKDKNKYLKLYFKNWEFDEDELTELNSTSNCVCGQQITNPYFITDSRIKEPDILVLGSECIKSFTSFGKKRFCSICAVEHKNRNYNECNKCLTTCNCGKTKSKNSDKCKACESLICACGKPKKSQYKTCWKCIPKRECEQCGKMFIKKSNYYICWDCKFGDEQRAEERHQHWWLENSG